MNKSSEAMVRTALVSGGDTESNVLAINVMTQAVVHLNTSRLAIGDKKHSDDGMDAYKVNDGTVITVDCIDDCQMIGVNQGVYLERTFIIDGKRASRRSA